MAIKEVSFLSYNGRDTVKGWNYTPLGEPVGVIQLIHGFNCHSRRYRHMIGHFNEAGFAVYADDHVGNGKTAADSGTFGDPGDKGFMTFINDERSLHELAARDYPGLPYFFYGHSMGSMILRAYAAIYGSDIKALVLSGVVEQLKGADELLKDERLPELLREGRGKDRELGAAYKARLFAGMNERIPGAKTFNDWISRDPAVVAEHDADPFNNHQGVTLDMISCFIELYRFQCRPDWAMKVPAALPAYLIAGDEDPCGNYGEGLYHVANELAKTGHRIKAKAYSGYRHEIQNNRAIRETVEQGIIGFFRSAL